jgi:predicted nucleic acid-binding Zn ribbon protein
VKRITFCPICGSNAPHGAEQCPACGAPLRNERRRRTSGIGFRAPLGTLIGALALLCVLLALVIYALT